MSQARPKEISAEGLLTRIAAQPPPVCGPIKRTRARAPSKLAPTLSFPCAPRHPTPPSPACWAPPIQPTDPSTCPSLLVFLCLSVSFSAAAGACRLVDEGPWPAAAALTCGAPPRLFTQPPPRPPAAGAPSRRLFLALSCACAAPVFCCEEPPFPQRPTVPSTPSLVDCTTLPTHLDRAPRPLLLIVPSPLPAGARAACCGGPPLPSQALAGVTLYTSPVNMLRVCVHHRRALGEERPRLLRQRCKHAVKRQQLASAGG